MIILPSNFRVLKYEAYNSIQYEIIFTFLYMAEYSERQFRLLHTIQEEVRELARARLPNTLPTADDGWDILPAKTLVDLLAVGEVCASDGQKRSQLVSISTCASIAVVDIYKYESLQEIGCKT